jgi:hypothetical protein
MLVKLHDITKNFFGPRKRIGWTRECTPDLVAPPIGVEGESFSKRGYEKEHSRRGGKNTGSPTPTSKHTHKYNL